MSADRRNRHDGYVPRPMVFLGTWMRAMYVDRDIQNVPSRKFLLCRSLLPARWRELGTEARTRKGSFLPSAPRYSSLGDLKRSNPINRHRCRCLLCIPCLGEEGTRQRALSEADFEALIPRAPLGSCLRNLQISNYQTLEIRILWECRPKTWPKPSIEHLRNENPTRT